MILNNEENIYKLQLLEFSPNQVFGAPSEKDGSVIEKLSWSWKLSIESLIRTQPVA